MFSTFMAGGIRLSQALRRMSPDSAHTCREPVRQRTHFHRQSKLLCRLMGRAEAEHVLGRGWRRRHMIIAWKPGTISISVPCFSAGSTHQQHSPAALTSSTKRLQQHIGSPRSQAASATWWFIQLLWIRRAQSVDIIESTGEQEQELLARKFGDLRF